MTSTWTRFTPKNLCPVCKHDHYCSITPDGKRIKCMWVESDAPAKSGGWMHPIDGNSNGGAIKRGEERIAASVNHEALTRFYCAAISLGTLADAARSLGLTEDSLVKFRFGFDGIALTVPMSNAKGQVVGIRRRMPDGSKTCFYPSRSGLFIPTDLDLEGGRIVCAEGDSDAPALHSIGLRCVVGRPGCNGGIDDLIALARNRRLTIVADNDPLTIETPRGTQEHPARIHLRNGVDRLRKAGISVNVAWPPDGIKDARNWVAAGLTREKLEAMT